MLSVVLISDLPWLYCFVEYDVEYLLLGFTFFFVDCWKIEAKKRFLPGVLQKPTSICDKRRELFGESSFLAIDKKRHLCYPQLTVSIISHDAHIANNRRKKTTKECCNGLHIPSCSAHQYKPKNEIIRNQGETRTFQHSFALLWYSPLSLSLFWFRRSHSRVKNLFMRKITVFLATRILIFSSMCRFFLMISSARAECRFIPFLIGSLKVWFIKFYWVWFSEYQPELSATGKQRRIERLLTPFFPSRVLRGIS